MGNQQSDFLGLTNTIETLKSKQSKLNQNEVALCRRQQSKIQQIIEQQDPFITHFEDIENIKYKKYQTGAIYIGSLDLNQRPQGYGKLVQQAGSVQVGLFNYGRLNGKGKSYHTNGSTYQGDFQHGQMTGQGTYKIAQYSYSGSFQKGTFSGEGLEKDGSKNYFFAGIFENGIRKKGKLVWTDKEEQFCYQGQLNEKQKFNGFGQLESSKGVYTGQFKDGKKHGFGRFKFANEVLYIGDYKDGVRQGYGTIYNKSKKGILQQQSVQNISYQGMFVKDLPQGIGRLYDVKDQQLKTGIFKQGSTIRSANQEQRSQFTNIFAYLSQTSIKSKKQLLRFKGIQNQDMLNSSQQSNIKNSQKIQQKQRPNEKD